MIEFKFKDYKNTLSSMVKSLYGLLTVPTTYVHSRTKLKTHPSELIFCCTENTFGKCSRFKNYTFAPQKVGNTGNLLKKRYKPYMVLVPFQSHPQEYHLWYSTCIPYISLAR